MFTFDSPLKPAEVFKAIQMHSEKQDTIFLVGGVVRDLLLQRPIHDIDLAVEGSVRSLAKKVANSLNGDFFMLDSERETARVLYSLPEDERVVIDFAAFRGKTLEEDLRARDFTINSMALSLDHPDQLIDPLHGSQDLKRKILRLCQPDALRKDPLRVLRGVRFAIDLECRIVPETWELMKDAAPELQWVSAERKRDEIFRILGRSDISSAFRLLDRVGALALIFPGLKAYDGLSKPSPDGVEGFEQTMVRLQKLEELLDLLGKKYNRRSVQNMTFGAAVLQLSRFRDRAQAHFDQDVSSGRSASELMLLAALLLNPAGLKGYELEAELTSSVRPTIDPASQIASGYGRTLALSQVEVKRLERMIAYQPLFQSLFRLGENLSPKDIYCYFRNTRDAGIDLTILGMADFLAAHRSSLSQELWLKLLGTVDRIWDAWWNRRSEVVDPPQLVTGNDFQNHFSIQPGPIVGLGLEAVREAQVEGKINTREDALEFMKKWLENQRY